MEHLPKLALSIRQPWAWAIINAGKDIENRGWHTSFRGPVCIHAAKGMTKAEYNEFEGAFGFDLRGNYPEPDGFDRGGIVGVATITACVKNHPSKWFFGAWGFVLADVSPVKFIPVKGALGFFDWRKNLPGDAQ